MQKTRILITREQYDNALRDFTPKDIKRLGLFFRTWSLAGVTYVAENPNQIKTIREIFKLGV